jgi:hypothetical protein
MRHLNLLSKILTVIGGVCAAPLILGVLYYCSVLILYIYGSLLGQPQTGTFQPQFEDAAKQADVLFAANGLCKVRQECMDKNLMGWTGTFESLNIEIYGVRDSKLLEQLKQIFVGEYQSTPGMKHLSITAYGISRSDFQKKLPILQRPIAHPTLSFTAGKDDK